MTKNLGKLEELSIDQILKRNGDSMHTQPEVWGASAVDQNFAYEIGLLPALMKLLHQGRGLDETFYHYVVGSGLSVDFDFEFYMSFLTFFSLRTGPEK